MIRTMKFKRVLALMVSFVMVLSSAVVTFASDTSGHWAESDINYLVSKNYVKGDDNGDIRPDANITRAEFVTVVNRVFGYTQKADSNFPDIDASAWYSDQFLTAKAHGYVSGDENGNANPESLITRAEVAVMVSRIMNLSAAKQPSFTDASDFPEWAADAIAALSEKGLISGYADGSFGANALITRAESFVIFTRVVKDKTDNTDNGESGSGSSNVGNIVAPGSSGGVISSGSGSGGGPAVVENNKVTITRANVETGLNWTSVKNTLKYQISITHEKTGIEYIKYATENKFSVKDVQDEILPALEDLSAKEIYIVKVKALRNSPYSDTEYSAPVKLTFQFDSIAQVTGVSIESVNESATEQFYLTWEPVENASGYAVTLKKGETIYYNDTTVNTNIDITQIIAKTGIDAKLVAEIQTLSDAIIDSEVLSTEVSISDFGGGDGSAEKPYLIYNARHFNNIRKETKGNFLVKKDIVLSDSYEPIAGFNGMLKGDVDGDKAVITVNINMPSALNVGLFGETGKCTIENLQVEGNILGKAYVGGVVGFSGETTIINCVNNAAVTAVNDSGSYACTGGIIGYVNGNSIIKDCINFGKIESTKQRNTGGIVGYATNSPKLLIENCENNGDIVAHNNNVGGIVGYINLGLITKSRNNGAVSSSAGSNVGGIAGANYDRIEECYNTGSVTGGQPTTGGIAGTHSGGIPIGAWLNNNYNTGKISHAGIVGAAGGNNASKVVKFNYNVGQTAAGKEAFSTVPSDSVLESNYFLDETEAANEYATGMTSAKMQVLENFIGFDREIWTIGEVPGYNYPTLKNNPHKAPSTVVVPLKTPSNIQVLENKNVITVQFNGDDRAAKHKVEVVLNGVSVPFETADASVTSVDITSALTQKGSYTIRITSIGDGVNYKNSLAAEVTYDMIDPNTVTAPTNVNVAWGGSTGTEDDYVLSFNPGKNAVVHDISLLKEGSEVPVTIHDVTETSVSLKDYVIGIDNANVGTYTVTVTAKKGESTAASLPIIVNSEFAGSREKDGETYQLIGCLRHLYNVKENGSYIQIADITEPMTKPIELFTGKYIGDGETQKSVLLNLEDLQTDGLLDGKEEVRLLTGIGMFREIRGTVLIENIRTEGSVTGKALNGVGGIAGVCTTDTAITIRNCVNNATITKTAKTNGRGSEGTGGIIGNQYGSAAAGAKIENCVNLGSISGINNIGGIAGYVRALTVGCVNKGSVYGQNVGGITGANYGRILQCCNLADIDIKSNTTAGGIAGLNASGNLKEVEDAFNIKECYNAGNITGKSNIAGIAANYQAASRNSFYGIRDCYNTGKITATVSVAGGIIALYGRKGRSGTTLVYNCYDAQKQTLPAVAVLVSGATDQLKLKDVYIRKVEGASTDGLTGTAKTLNELKTLLTDEASFNSNGVWVKEGSYMLPQLKDNKHIGSNPEPDENTPVDTDISALKPQNVKVSADTSDVYTVSFDEMEGANAYDISLLKDGAEAPVVLSTVTNSVNITDTVLGTELANVGKYTITVTAKNNSYSSLSSDSVTLDSRYAGGEGTEAAPYEIANVRHFKNIDENKSAHYLQIADFTIEDGYTPVCPDYNNCFTGTYRGKQDLENGVKYRTVHFNNVTAPAQFFGLFGAVGETAVVEFIGTTGTVNSTANYVGGIAYQNIGVIQNCYSSANLTTTASYCGGIVGDNRGVIENCYTTGNISAASYAAGIAAITANGNQNVRISKCYATGDMTVTSNYACGIIGGVGMSSGASTNLKVVIEDCYFTGMINGGRNGGIIGLSADCSKKGKVEVVLQRNFVTNTGYANKIYGYGLSGTYKNQKTFKADNAKNFYLTGGTAAAFNRGKGLSAEEFKTLIDKNLGTEEAPNVLFPSDTWILKAGFDFPQLISNPHVGE